MQRPRFHFTPDGNWINDPNGLVFFDGEHHLFFQHNPFGDRWGHMSWGHAVSRDLVTWEHLPVALPEVGPVMAFSGSAVVDWNNTSGLCVGDAPCLIAIYTAHTITGSSEHDYEQSQYIAVSHDRGRTWMPFADNPVLDIGLRDFRDPHVFWHAPSSSWVMTVSRATERRLSFYRSENLREWRHASDFGPTAATGGDWECPLLVELPVDGDARMSRWLLKVDINPGSPIGGSASQYFIGSFDGASFTVEHDTSAPRWVDHGRDFYAALAWTERPDYWLGWMNNWEYAQETPTQPWRGAMTAPRRIGLRTASDGIRLAQSPAPEIDDHRGRQWSFCGANPPDMNQQIVAAGCGGSALDIRVTFNVATSERVGEIGMSVRVGADQETRIGIDLASHELFLDRTRSGNSAFGSNFAGRHTARLSDPHFPTTLRILVDTCSVEVFADDGATVITDLIFPDDDSNGIALFATGPAEVDIEVEVWEIIE